MITLLSIRRVPDTWEPQSVWYLVMAELLIVDTPLVSLLVLTVRMWLAKGG